MAISLTCLLCAVFAAATLHAQAPAAQSTPVHSTSLTEPGDVADAAAVNRAISRMVKNAASCGAAQDAQSCACSFTNDLKKLKRTYDAAVAKHPRWNAEGSVVAYVDSASGKSVTINLPGVKRQLDACAQRQTR